MEDIVNIELAVPRPIRFNIGPYSRVVSGLTPFVKALEGLRLVEDMERTLVAQQQSAAELETARAAGSPDFEERRTAAMAALDEHLETVRDLNDWCNSLWQSEDAIDLDYPQMQEIVARIYLRAYGVVGDAPAAGDGDGPPTNGNPSTSQRSSTRSARSTAAARRSGSRNR